jgi:hypothetical protein
MPGATLRPLSIPDQPRDIADRAHKARIGCRQKRTTVRLPRSQEHDFWQESE